MSAGTAVRRATGPMTVKFGKIEEEVEEVEEAAVNAVEATLVIPADDPLLDTVRESVVVAGPGQVKDALVSSARAAVSFALKRATSKGIVQITEEAVEVVVAARLIATDEIPTAETVVTATVEKEVTATAEMVVTATAEMVMTATTTGATVHTLEAALPVTTIAEKEMETEAVTETEVLMKWVIAWVRPQEGTTRDHHPANKRIVTVM